MHYVYLVGPITGCSYNGCTDWRKEFAKKVNCDSIHCLDPMRGKLYLSQSTCIEDKYDDTLMSTGKAIFHRDRWDCMRADIIVANFLGAERVSIGSVMEIAWANSKETPIVVVMDNQNVHDHAMLREAAGWLVPTLDQAVEVTLAMLDPKHAIYASEDEQQVRFEVHKNYINDGVCVK